MKASGAALRARPVLTRSALLGLALAAAGCGGSDGGADRPGMGGALGGSARTETLARTQLARRPDGPLAWVAHEVRLEPGQALRHSHEVGFVFGRAGRHRLEAAQGDAAVAAGEGAALTDDGAHGHVAGSAGGVFWEISLAAPGSAPPRGSVRRVFESEPLRGIPPAPEASFIEVVLPPRGGETTVHTHPGPEFIYQLSGRIRYQNAIVGTKTLGPGGAEGIPPDTPVQKRNPTPRPAAFLSWFLVDPDEPFAPSAEFADP